MTYKDGREWVFAEQREIGIKIASYASRSADGRDLRKNLCAAAKKPVRAVVGGQVYILKVTIFESFDEDTFKVGIHLAQKLDRNTRLLSPRSKVK